MQRDPKTGKGMCFISKWRCASLEMIGGLPGDATYHRVHWRFHDLDSCVKCKHFQYFFVDHVIGLTLSEC